MNCRIKSIPFLLLLACTQVDSNQESALETNGYHTSNYLIEAEEVQKVVGDSGIKIIDFRPETSYLKGHIKEALNIWRPDIEDTTYSYSGMMAKKEVIEELLSSIGISNEDQLIVYDDRGSCDAARLWWVLNQYGFKNIKILNGGLQAWKMQDSTTQVVPNQPIRTTFELPNQKNSNSLISKEALVDAMNADENPAIIDTRSLEEYTGERQKKGASRAGRIPGSTRIDWIEALDDEGKFKPKDQLLETYGALLKEELIVTYCHSGVRSAHTAFVLTQLLGYQNVKNYDGSWIEWSYDNKLPLEKDSTTSILE